MSIQQPTLTIQNVVPRSRVSVIWRVSGNDMSNEYYQLEAPDNHERRVKVVCPLPTYSCDIDVNIFHMSYVPYTQRIWCEGSGEPVILTVNQEEERNYEPQLLRPGAVIEFEPPDIPNHNHLADNLHPEFRELYLQAMRGYDSLSTYADNKTIPLDETIARQTRELLEETINDRQSMVDRLFEEMKNADKEDNSLEPVKNIHKRRLDV